MKWQIKLLLTIGIIIVVYGASYTITHLGGEKVEILSVEGFGEEVAVLSAKGNEKVNDTLSEKEMTKVEYTYNSEVVEYDDNTGNALLYGGIKFGDDSGTRIEDIPSLKDCQFCNRIKIRIESDKTHLVEVYDYNWTHMEVGLSFNKSNLQEYESEVEDGKMKTKIKTGEGEIEIEIEEGVEELRVIKLDGNKSFKFGKGTLLPCSLI